MKRFQLFEFEDLPWFPDWLRDCLTRYLVSFHDVMQTPTLLGRLVERALRHSPERRILDLCSGGGGPMLEVIRRYNVGKGDAAVRLELSDLYPNLATAERINSEADSRLRYLTKSVDATQVPSHVRGLRTMTCALHHLEPRAARSVLKNAQDAQQPFLAYELSDNSYPRLLWWLTFFPLFGGTLLFTPKVRPLSWRQLSLTYLVPVIPFFVAWDGAVSNARTYTPSDLEELLAPLENTREYRWESGSVRGRFGKKLWLMGLPRTHPRMDAYPQATTSRQQMPAAQS